MPNMGDDKGTGDVIDIVSANRIDLGTDNGQAYEIKNRNEINNKSGSIYNGNLTLGFRKLSKYLQKVFQSRN